MVWASWVAELVKNPPAMQETPGWFLGRSPGEGIGYSLQYSWASLVAQTVKSPPAMPETWVQSLGWEDPLEEGMATHSSVLAWRIPWTEEPGRLQSSGLQRVRHDCRDLADMLNLFRNFQIVFQSSSIILHSYGRMSDQFLCILTNAWCHFLFHPLWYEWCVVISDFVPEAELRIKRSRKGRGADFTQDMWNV